jgi:hypothetical protein
LAMPQRWSVHTQTHTHTHTGEYPPRKLKGVWGCKEAVGRKKPRSAGSYLVLLPSFFLGVTGGLVTFPFDSCIPHSILSVRVGRTTCLQHSAVPPRPQDARCAANTTTEQTEETARVGRSVRTESVWVMNREKQDESKCSARVTAAGLPNRVLMKLRMASQPQGEAGPFLCGKRDGRGKESTTQHNR